MNPLQLRNTGYFKRFSLWCHGSVKLGCSCYCWTILDRSVTPFILDPDPDHAKLNRDYDQAQGPMMTMI